MSLTYGVQLPQGWLMDLVGITDPVEAYETMTRVAQTADKCGYESVWLVDHFHTVPHPSQEVTFECWMSTAALARDTKRVRIGQMVTCNGYRHPDAPERLRYLREAIQVLLAMWTQDEATFEGTYYQVRGAINQPKGVQQPHIPLLIGGSGEKVTLKLVAQYGDACNVAGDPSTVARKFALLKEHCETVGRDYESIRRTVSTMVVIADTDEQAIAQVPAMFRSQAQLEMALVGTLETVRARLKAYEAVGVQELIIIFPDAVQGDSIRRFAEACIV